MILLFYGAQESTCDPRAVFHEIPYQLTTSSGFALINPTTTTKYIEILEVLRLLNVNINIYRRVLMIEI